MKEFPSSCMDQPAMKYEQLGIPPEEAQYLETRQFQAEEIYRWFRVPPLVQNSLRTAPWISQRLCVRGWV